MTYAKNQTDLPCGTSIDVIPLDVVNDVRSAET